MSGFSDEGGDGGDGGDRKALEVGLHWHDKALAYKSLSDGRLPIDRGGYAFWSTKPALYVDLDGQTLESDLKMSRSAIATIYKGETNIQRILILDRFLSADKKTLKVCYFCVDRPNGKASYTITSPLIKESWDQRTLASRRVFLDVWM